jgi:hypothetical protein
MAMQIRKKLEQPVKILSMEMYNLGYMLAFELVFAVSLGIVKIWWPVPTWVNIFPIVFLVTVIYILKWGAGKNHPSYIISLISYSLLQPRKLRFQKPNWKRGIPRNV